MIKKMRRRYLITNMALLSCTLLICLAILFGILYHSEVDSSYTVMQTMMDGAPPHGEPKGPPDGSRGEPPEDMQERDGEPPERQEDFPENAPPPELEEEAFYGDVFVTPLTASVDFRGDPSEGEGWEQPQDPPYWDFGTPEDRGDWRGPNDRTPGGWGTPPEDQPQQGESQSSAVTTLTSAASSTKTTKTTAQTTAPARTDTQNPTTSERQQSTSGKETQPTKDTPGYAAPSTETVPKIPASTQETTTAPTSSKTTQNGTTVSSTVSSSASTDQVFSMKEGHYIPDGFIADVDEEGNIESYAGNKQDASDEDSFRAVHHAMDEVKRSGEPSGTVEIGDESYRFLYQPDSEGNFRLVLMDRTQEQATVKKLVFIFLLIAAGGLICMFGLSWLLAGWTVTPVAAAWEKQKQFVADASHELKTPLAVISANTEVVLTNPQESVAAQSKWLNYIQSETMRMSKLITVLLSVARLDSKENVREHAEPLALSETVSNVCLVFEPIIYEHHKTLNTVIQRNVQLRADEDNIKQLLSILLDNAVLHSVPEAQITVSLSKDSQGKIRLAVSNTAKDIPKEELEHLFDRFYRLDKEGSPNGSGLGLSIAKSIVKQLGGTLTVTSENQLVTFVAAF